MKQTRKINGIDLYFEKFGEGENTLLLLHGNGENGEIYKEFLEKIPFDGAIYVPDTRGHGKSEFGLPFTLRQFAEDFKELLTAEGRKNVTVIGYSDGANIAMHLCNLYRLKKCVLISGNFLKKGLKTSFLLPCSLFYYLTTPLSFLPKIKKHRLLLKLMLTDIGLYEEDLRRIDVPCEVICASRDVIKLKHSKLIAELLNTELRIAENSTHYNIIEKTTRLIADESLKI